MRAHSNSADIGRCGCGRRIYCDGSHGLTEAQWQELRAKELAAAETAGVATTAAESGGKATPEDTRR